MTETYRLHVYYITFKYDRKCQKYFTKPGTDRDFQYRNGPWHLKISLIRANSNYPPTNSVRHVCSGTPCTLTRREC